MDDKTQKLAKVASDVMNAAKQRLGIPSSPEKATIQHSYEITLLVKIVEVMVVSTLMISPERIAEVIRTTVDMVELYDKETKK